MKVSASINAVILVLTVSYPVAATLLGSDWNGNQECDIPGLTGSPTTPRARSPKAVDADVVGFQI